VGLIAAGYRLGATPLGPEDIPRPGPRLKSGGPKSLGRDLFRAQDLREEVI